MLYYLLSWRSGWTWRSFRPPRGRSRRWRRVFSSPCREAPTSLAKPPFVEPSVRRKVTARFKNTETDLKRLLLTFNEETCRAFCTDNSKAGLQLRSYYHYDSSPSPVVGLDVERSECLMVHIVSRLASSSIQLSQAKSKHCSISSCRLNVSDEGLGTL